VRPAHEASQVGHGEVGEVVELASAEGLDEAVLGGDQQNSHRRVPLDRNDLLYDSQDVQCGEENDRVELPAASPQAGEAP
jgi:hypothetical protein